MGLFKLFSTAPEAPDDEDAQTLMPESFEQPEEVPKFEPVPVLEAAGVDETQRARVEKAQELLKSLPEETPDELKRNIVEASLKAFDVSIEAIVEAAGNEIKALDAFIAEGNANKDQVLQEGAERIAQLEQEIAEVKAMMAKTEADQAGLDEATRAVIEEVRPVADFFVLPDATNATPPEASEPANDVDMQLETEAEDDAEPSIIVDRDLVAGK